MATATVKEVVIEPARTIPAVKERTVTLTLTENEAAGLAALTGRLQCQEQHPNSLYGVYQALSVHVPWSKRPRVVVGDGEKKSIKFG